MVACACVVLVQVWARTPLLTLAAVVAFLVSLWPFYFPIRFCCDDQGVEIDYRVWRRRVPWARYRSFIVLSDGVALSPFSRPRALERFRILMLPCPDNRDEVIAGLPANLVRREAAAAAREPS